MDRSIPFVDTHMHLWELDRFAYDWLSGDAWDETMGDYRAICVDWGPARMRREFHGQKVTGSVHVEAGYSGADPVEETAWLAGVASEYGFPNALVVQCDLRARSVDGDLARHVDASDLVRGVRAPMPPDASTDASFLRGYRALSDHGLSFELTGSPGTLVQGVLLARDHPDTPVILGHAGFPLARDVAYFASWRREIAALAVLENLACKISGFASVDHRWTVDSLRPWVLECIEAFGPDRIMFGTNWPVDGLYAPYVEQVDAWRLILAQAGLAREDQAKMLHANAERIYRI